jgi:chemotaxis protein methyltransferase WspC
MAGVDFNALLKDAMGLDAASLGPTAIDRAVQTRMLACEMKDVHGYWLRVRSSPTEMQELIETVVVPETWFFRDPQAFVALTDMARAEFLANPAKSELRLLSLPCSSGEEPFSMAIALLDAGIPANRFSIDGVDISKRALDIAGRGTYGSNSFRGQDLEFRARHFEPADARWKLTDMARKRVRFQQGNLFAVDFLPGQGLYDYIFCRNVLIYFDQETQVRALEVLLRLLNPRGCLFVGPSETGLLPRERLTSAQLPMAFAFHHAALAGPRVATPVPRKSMATPRKAAAGARKTVHQEFGRRAVDKAAPTIAAPSPSPDLRRACELALAQVQQLANQGRLIEATAAGERYLREYGASAHGYCLLGVIRDAEGDLTAAAALYRKALYLDPQHQESLSHLAFLLEKQGNASAARVLRDRLQRLEAQAAG